jgi:glutaredoxin
LNEQPITLIVYGTSWCVDCRRSKQFLSEQNIPFRWIDVDENPEALAFIISKNGGKRSVPLIVFEDDSFLVEPTNEELAAKLGL